MKLKVVRSALLHALERTAAADTQLDAGPFPGAVLLQAAASRLVLTLRDHVYTASTSVACAITSDGAVAVPHRTLHEYVRLMSGDTIVMDVRGATLHARTAADQINLPCDDAAHYPHPPKAPQGEKVYIPSSAIRFVLEHVAHAMHSDLVHPTLASARLEVVASGVEARATDGQRFAVAFSSVDVELPSEQWTLSSRLVRKISGLSVEDAISVAITGTATHLFFTWSDLSLVALRRDECAAHDIYSDRQQLRVWATGIVKRAELTRAMSLIAGIPQGAARRASAVEIRLLERAVRLSGTNGSDTVATTSVDATVKSPGAKVTLPAHALRDAVQNAEGDVVTIEFIDSPSRAVVVRSESEPGHVICVLPIHAEQGTR